MKAITCTQCGSLIKHLSPYQQVAECDYCGAELIAGEQFAQVKLFEPKTPEFHELDGPVYQSEPIQPIFIVISGIGLFTLLLFAFSFFGK